MASSRRASEIKRNWCIRLAVASSCRSTLCASSVQFGRLADGRREKGPDFMFQPLASCQISRDSTSSRLTSLRMSEMDNDGLRSEEHTSELQSLMRISYAVFCLKNKKK